MRSKETEQLGTKIEEVKSEMAKLKASIEKNKKNLAEADKLIAEESTELFHLEIKEQKGNKADKSMDAIFTKVAEQGQSHLDVSPGDHTLVGYEALHPHAKSVNS